MKIDTTGWSKETPKEDGWYWMFYKVDGTGVVCPCKVIHLNIGTVVTSARNDSWVKKSSGTILKHDGKLDRSIRFAPEGMIPYPTGVVLDTEIMLDYK